MWYWPWTSQNRPVNLSANGVTRFAAKPIISDTSSEPVVLPSVFILRPSTERQSVPRSLGGSAPSHVPAAQESAICVPHPPPVLWPSEDRAFSDSTLWPHQWQF